jgi:hypothetical protein
METVEAEVVHLLRGRYGQWPAFQTEIHFHPSTSSHRRAAREVLELYPKRAAHNHGVQRPASAPQRSAHGLWSGLRGPSR